MRGSSRAPVWAPMMMHTVMGTNASPARSGLYPRTFCKNKVRKYHMAKKAAPTSSMTTLAPVTDRLENKEKGTRGALATRRSM